MAAIDFFIGIDLNIFWYFTADSIMSIFLNLLFVLFFLCLTELFFHYILFSKSVLSFSIIFSRFLLIWSLSIHPVRVIDILEQTRDEFIILLINRLWLFIALNGILLDSSDEPVDKPHDQIIIILVFSISEDNIWFL